MTTSFSHQSIIFNAFYVSHWPIQFLFDIRMQLGAQVTKIGDSEYTIIVSGDWHSTPLSWVFDFDLSNELQFKF